MLADKPTSTPFASCRASLKSRRAKLRSRAEHFFASDAMSRFHIGENGRLHEPAVGVIAGGESIAAGDQLSAFLLRDADVFEISLEAASR
jgi:hypothetical protein